MTITTNKEGQTVQQKQKQIKQQVLPEYYYTSTDKTNKEQKLTYIEYKILKQIAYQVMLQHNKTKQNITYQQTLVALMHKTQTQLISIIDRYTNSIAKQQNKKQIERYNSEIIIKTKLTKEKLSAYLKQLNTIYYLDLDIDYNNMHSMQLAYQQLIYYKKVGITLQQKPNNIDSYGDTTIMDNIQAKEVN